MFQDLPSRIDRSSRNEGKKRRRKMHPMFIEELIFSSKNPQLGIKIALSLYKEKMPWVYDEGIHLVNRISHSKTGIERRVLSDFEDMLMFSFRHPLLEDLIIENEDEFILFKELPKIIMVGLERLINTKT